MILANSNRFYLPGTGRRFVHLATIHDSIREYICFACNLEGKIYIEEITGGRGPDRIEDDQLAEDIASFLTQKGVLDVGKPTLPDDEWLTTKKNT